MKLNNYKLVFVAIGLVAILLVATPALGDIMHLPGGTPFSEIYILGPDHMLGNYQYNVAIDQNYSIFAGVTNHLGSFAYYVLYVKLRNQTDFYPDSTNGNPSSLSPLYESRFALKDGQNWENAVNFSITDATFTQNQSVINKLVINNSVFSLDKPTAWDAQSTAFPYSLLLELWIYNFQTGSVEFNNRFVNLQFNLTQTA